MLPPVRWCFLAFLCLPASWHVRLASGDVRSWTTADSTKDVRYVKTFLMEVTITKCALVVIGAFAFPWKLALLISNLVTSVFLVSTTTGWWRSYVCVLLCCGGDRAESEHVRWWQNAWCTSARR